MSHKFAGLDVNKQDGGYPETDLMEQELGGRLSESPYFRSTRETQEKRLWRLDLCFKLRYPETVLTTEFILTAAETVH